MERKEKEVVHIFLKKSLCFALVKNTSSSKGTSSLCQKQEKKTLVYYCIQVQRNDQGVGIASMKLRKE